MESLHLLQARYWDSSASFECARAIIDRKCWNMSHLLRRALPYRQVLYPEHARIIRASLSHINEAAAKLRAAPDRTILMLAEGRASRAYWTGFSVIARCPAEWKRVHPRATDPWNRALNIGYTILANLIREKIRAYGLTPEIGMLHAPRNGKEPLIYDFQELLRQPAVDAALTPLFSRSANPSAVADNQIVGAVLKRFDERAHRDGGRWKIRDLIDRDIGDFRAALLNGIVFIPTRFSWAHKKSRLGRVG